MIAPLSFPSFSLLISFFIFIASCHAQEKTEATESSTTEQNIKAPYVDPLFFIEGQLCQHVRKIFQDKNGNLWFGTNVYDLMRYDGDRLVYFSEKDGLGGGRITGIVEDKEGNVWFGTYSGLTKYNGESFTNFSEENGLLNHEIWSLLIDGNGKLWIGTNKGISIFDGQNFTTFPIPKAQVENPDIIYSPDRIVSIAEDKNGNLWFGTDGFGMCKYDPSAKQTGGKAFTHFTTEDGLPNNTISELMVDSKGNLWIGTYWGGVSKYDGKEFTNFTKDGLVSGVEVGAFYEGKNGDIWFAAENHGVYRYDARLPAGQGKVFTNLYEKDGLPTNGILSIFEDREGRFWFGGWGGLFRFDGKSFTSVTKDGPWDM